MASKSGIEWRYLYIVILVVASLSLRQYQQKAVNRQAKTVSRNMNDENP